jgi:uncharacterized protein
MVICKQPVAGRVKTRMCPPLTHDEAADLAAAAVRDTFAVGDAWAPARRVAVFEGSNTDWIPAGWEHVPQRTGGLDVRLADAFEDVMRDDRPSVLVAMDTPQITVAQLTSAAGALHEHDAVIGLTDDGGYWLIGLRHPNRGVFEGVPMSVDTTGAAQVERIQSLGLSLGFADQLVDLDTCDDVARVAGAFPELATSRWWNARTHALAAQESR